MEEISLSFLGSTFLSFRVATMKALPPMEQKLYLGIIINQNQLTLTCKKWSKAMTGGNEAMKGSNSIKEEFVVDAK